MNKKKSTTEEQDKAFILYKGMPRFFIPFVVFWNILKHPLQWEFSDGGWGNPHFYNNHCEVMVHYPYIPIWFDIEYGEYGDTKTIYPILTWILMQIIFWYLLLSHLFLKNGV